jgi:hypothetical protein
MCSSGQQIQSSIQTPSTVTPSRDNINSTLQRSHFAQGLILASKVAYMVPVASRITFGLKPKFHYRVDGDTYDDQNNDGKVKTFLRL